MLTVSDSLVAACTLHIMQAKRSGSCNTACEQFVNEKEDQNQFYQFSELFPLLGYASYKNSLRDAEAQSAKGQNNFLCLFEKMKGTMGRERYYQILNSANESLSLYFAKNKNKNKHE